MPENGSIPVDLDQNGVPRPQSHNSHGDDNAQKRIDTSQPDSSVRLAAPSPLAAGFAAAAMQSQQDISRPLATDTRFTQTTTYAHDRDDIVVQYHPRPADSAWPPEHTQHEKRPVAISTRISAPQKKQNTEESAATPANDDVLIGRFGANGTFQWVKGARQTPVILEEFKTAQKNAPKDKDTKSTPSHFAKTHGFMRRQYQYFKYAATNPFSVGGMMFTYGAAAFNYAPTIEGVAFSALMVAGGTLDALNTNKEKIITYRRLRHPEFRGKERNQNKGILEKAFKYQGVEQILMGVASSLVAYQAVLSGNTPVAIGMASYAVARGLYTVGKFRAKVERKKALERFLNSKAHPKEKDGAIKKAWVNTKNFAHKIYSSAKEIVTDPLSLGSLTFAAGSSLMRLSPTPEGMLSAGLIFGGGVVQSVLNKRDEIKAIFKEKEEDKPHLPFFKRSLHALTTAATGYIMQASGLYLASSMATGDAKTALMAPTIAFAAFAVGSAVQDFREHGPKPEPEPNKISTKTADKPTSKEDKQTLSKEERFEKLEKNATERAKDKDREDNSHHQAPAPASGGAAMAQAMPETIQQNTPAPQHANNAATPGRKASNITKIALAQALEKHGKGR
jgi:hypothetical protein